MRSEIKNVCIVRMCRLNVAFISVTCEYSFAISFITRVGNLFLVASQNQSLQGMAGRTYFLPTIPFPLLFMKLKKLGNLWILKQINS